MMTMDPHTLNSLEYPVVLQWLAEGANSALGAELLLALEPLTDAEALQREEERVREALQLLEQHEEPPLGGLRDCREFWERLRPEGAALEPEELVLIADFCETARRVRQFFDNCAGQLPRLRHLAEGVTPLPELERRLRESIEPSGEITDHASPLLAELRVAIARQERHIQSSLERLVTAWGGRGDLQDSFYTQRNGRYVVPVKAGSRGQAKGIVHDVSASGETFFIEPLEIVEQSNSLTGLRAELREEIRRVLVALSDLARRELPFHEENTTRLGLLDSLFTRAAFGFKHGWQLPGALPEATTQPATASVTMRVTGAHHPLLRVKLAGDSIPLDLELHEGDQAVVISGPNAGGKTTALKTIGLLTLLRQAAIPLPAHPDTRLPLRGRVLVDIGDDQSIIEGVSTFSAHIRRLASIVAQADPDTLVLLDELGAATDPAEGGALATAIIESLEARGATVIVTSHLAALKHWAHQHPSARNCSFQLERETRRPTFRLQMDTPGVSQALIVAEQQGMTPGVIARAQELLPHGAVELGALLSDLEKQRAELDKRLAEASLMRRRGVEEKEKWEKRQGRLRERRRELERELVAEREVWLREKRAEIEKRIATLEGKRELLQVKKDVQQLQEEEKRRAEQLRRETVEDSGQLADLKPGARVRVQEFNDEGRIVSLDLDRLRAVVALRKINVETPLDKLQLLANQEEDSDCFGGVRVNVRHEPTPSRLDLHGQRVEEALEGLETYLDRALLQQMPQVTIIHGHGSGALRAAIHERLRHHPQIRRFRFGNEGEGGGAVTIIELR